jgi:hypothetical protein
MEAYCSFVSEIWIKQNEGFFSGAVSGSMVAEKK